MKKRYYRKRRQVRSMGHNPENGYAYWTFLCLFILLSFCYKEECMGMVFPKSRFQSEREETWGFGIPELVFSLVDGHYGFYKAEMASGKQGETSKDEGTAEFDYFKKEFRNEENKTKTENEDVDADAASDDDGQDFDDENYGRSLNPDSPYDTYADSLEELVLEENRKAASGEFVRQESPVVTLDYEKLKDFTYLKQHFYTVDRTTNITEERLDAKKFLTYSAALTQDNSKPQILIYHTHSQEGFTDSIPGDTATTIVGVGEHLTQILREEYGFNVIHDTGTYDVENRDYAYSVSAPALEKILEENPSIEVIIDLHRDGVAGSTHLVKDVGGRPTAQFMFFNGLSYLNATGPIDYLENPYIEQNLAFSFQLKLKADTYYPGFSRNIYLKGLRYNLHYREKSVLIEVGAQTNTVEEAMNAAEPIAHILALVLKGE